MKRGCAQRSWWRTIGRCVSQPSRRTLLWIRLFVWWVRGPIEARREHCFKNCTRVDHKWKCTSHMAGIFAEFAGRPNQLIKCWLSISRSLPWAYVLWSHDHMIIEFVLVLEFVRYIFNIFGTLTGSWGAMGAPRTSHWAQNRISIDLEAILDSQNGGFSAITSQNSHLFSSA